MWCIRMTFLHSAYLISQILGRFLNSISTCRTPPPPKWDRSLEICSFCCIMYIMVRKQFSLHPSSKRSCSLHVSGFIRQITRGVPSALLHLLNIDAHWGCSRMGGGTELVMVGLETTNNIMELLSTIVTPGTIWPVDSRAAWKAIVFQH